ncbi:diguanylate cyclase [Reinekea marinisedimentorum]|uniref:diguanylate cyclase n=1 Tax=Reinekea marinisedimentorum TaxID=230495 RepID=A0A4R3I848_9GAMM|nr:diguanylate cyclase [Reinekea marinisedimentorum]TCS41454.1 diguanylate cyclase (GGDEF)-like protein [Reinekea marinisedimentorum]
MQEKQSQLEDLRQFFGRRVYQQARSLVNSWGALQDVHWNEVWYREFSTSVEKLTRLAKRYNLTSLLHAAEKLTALLQTANIHNAPNSALLEQMNEAVNQVAEACSRVNDDVPVQSISSGRKPVYLCFRNQELAESVCSTLAHFGIPGYVYTETDLLEQSILHRMPAAMVIDVACSDDNLQWIAHIQQHFSEKIPVVFYSMQEPTIESRLSAVRCNGIAFLTGKLDSGELTERLVSIYSMQSDRPFRVLVVDDSQSQAAAAEKALNYAGIFTRNVTDPMAMLNALDSFNPDAVLMDMYMPGCTGPELAQIIRQQPKYDAVPIIYLSAESDIKKQLQAVSLGGDDFITKPFDKGVLITTVLNRCRRYRNLKHQLKRDSLTKLLNHKNILQELELSVEAAAANNQSLCFAMIDIDHFKKVNDAYGHSMGDRVIAALSLYLRQRFRVTDSIGRYGGEEFAVVLPATRPEVAEALLNDVREDFSKLVHQLDGEEVGVTFSCGIACCTEQEDAISLSQRADKALYRAKANGRNCVELAEIQS